MDLACHQVGELEQPLQRRSQLQDGRRPFVRQQVLCLLVVVAGFRSNAAVVVRASLVTRSVSDTVSIWCGAVVGAVSNQTRTHVTRTSPDARNCR